MQLLFEKAIEEAVKRNWIERFPLENKQVEEMIKQAIDALPQIVEWKKLDEDVKIAFLEGHVKKLLSTVGIEGWGTTKLNEVFEAEANKRIMSAAIADARGLLQKLDSDGSSKYLRYTEAVLSGTAEAIK